MKAIPIKDLQTIVNHWHERGMSAVFQDDVEWLFHKFGDDWYKESTFSEYELCGMNIDRESYIQSLSVNLE